MTSIRFIAAKKGERKYIGNPCRVCGNTERYTINGACIACSKNARKKDMDKVRELLKKAEESAA